MTALRRVRPLVGLKEDVATRASPGRRPELRWVDPLDLLVDDTYQRDLLSERSRRLIVKIARNFQWRKFKPPIVVEVTEGLHVVDGQHTATGAATARIPEIPVFVVDAAGLEDRASSFVAHNRDRIEVTSIDVYRAELAAGKENAVDTDSVCRRAGVRIRHVNPAARVDIGDTAAVGAVRGLVGRQGALRAREILEALVRGGRAPITAAEILGLEATTLLVPRATTEQLASVVSALGDRGVVAAKLRAAQEERPHKAALFADYVALLERQTGLRRVFSE